MSVSWRGRPIGRCSGTLSSTDAERPRHDRQPSNPRITRDGHRVMRYAAIDPTSELSCIPITHHGCHRVAVYGGTRQGSKDNLMVFLRDPHLAFTVTGSTRPDGDNQWLVRRSIAIATHQRNTECEDEDENVRKRSSCVAVASRAGLHADAHGDRPSCYFSGPDLGREAAPPGRGWFPPPDRTGRLRPCHVASPQRDLHRRRRPVQRLISCVARPGENAVNPA